LNFELEKPMPVYLHEIVHTVPGQEEPYMSAMIARRGYSVLAPGEGGESLQLGLWRTTGTSGVWPKVINLWELPDYSQLAHNFSVQFSEARDPYLEDWWNRNLHLRRGGFDRLLQPAPYCPDRATLLEQGVKGRVFLHEIVHVPYGEAGDYLATLERTFLPAAGRHGWQLIGAYSVLLRPREALVIWAMREWAGLSNLLAAAPDDPALREWSAYRARTVTCSEEMVLLAGRVNPMYLADG
jgi:hypothetical protein